MRSGSTMKLAHRVYYESRVGDIPCDRQLHHRCEVRACVNPDHLEPVTPGENVRLGANTKLNWQMVLQIRNSSEKQRVLAQRYGITQGQVSRIKNRLSWR